MEWNEMDYGMMECVVVECNMEWNGMKWIMALWSGVVEYN